MNLGMKRMIDTLETLVLSSVTGKVVARDLPFSSPFAEEVKPGLLISISGRVRESANRFDVNLVSAEENVAFHFNPRFSEHCVVRNSRIENVWGTEERSGTFPFLQSSDFEILILVTRPAYRVAVNRKHHCDYQHRIDTKDVKQLKIDGDVIIDRVQYRVEPLYVDNSGKINLALVPSTFFNPTIPLNHNISGKIVPDFIAYISGRPGSFPYRFKFEFKDDAKVFFHFDVRFDECTVVRNHYDNGWGKEERELRHFPFTPGVGFDMIFYVRDVDFMVAVNGQHFLNFTHRLLPLSGIKYFNINGDVVITSVRFCD